MPPKAEKSTQVQVHIYSQQQCSHRQKVKTPRWPSAGNQCGSALQGDYLALRRNKNFIYTVSESQHTMLSERSQMDTRSHIVSFYLYEIHGIDKSIETEHRLIVARSFPLQWQECFGTRQRWWPHNTVNVLNANVLLTLRWLMLCYMTITSVYYFVKC